MKRLFGSLALMMSMAAGHCSMLAHENSAAGAQSLATANICETARHISEK